LLIFIKHKILQLKFLYLELIPNIYFVLVGAVTPTANRLSVAHAGRTIKKACQVILGTLFLAFYILFY